MAKLTQLQQLKALAVRAQASIAEVAQAAAEAVTAVSNAKADKVRQIALTVPATGWASDSTAAYPYYRDISVSGLTANDVVAVVVAPASTAVANAAGLSTTESRAGALRLRAQRAPSAAISAYYHIIR